MRSVSKSNINQELIVVRLYKMFLRLLQRIFARKFFIGYCTGIIFTVMIYHMRQPPENLKFEYESNLNFIQQDGVDSSLLWNQSWDG